MRRWAAIVGLAAVLVLGGCGGGDDFRVHYLDAGPVIVRWGDFRTRMETWHIGAAEIDCMLSELGVPPLPFTVTRATFDRLFATCGVDPAKVWWSTD